MNPKFILVGTGVIILLVTLASIFGVVPSLSVAGLPCGTPVCSTNPSLQASFTTRASGLTVTVTDTSTYNGVAFVTGNVTWGDGSGLFALSGFGAKLTHAYVSNGTYLVTELIAAKGYSFGGYFTLTSQFKQSLVLGGSGGGGGGSSSVKAAFGWAGTTSTLSITLTDRTVVQNATVSAISIAWGDGAIGAVTVGGSVSHTYPNVGTYNVTETVSWSAGGGPTQYSVSNGKVVVSTNTPPPPPGCTATCPSPSVVPGLNVASGVLLFASFGLIAIPLVTARLEIVGIGVTLLMVLGAVIGYFI